MARGVPGLALALAVLYAGCADPSVEDLRRQSYVWDAEDGLCGRVISVDVGRRVWREHGCEANSSVTLAGTASKAEVQALADGFLLARSFDLALLPAGTCEVTHLFQENPTDRPSFAIAICGRADASSFDDIEGLIEPFASLARAFQQLP
jgi:hypothetical protein